MPICIECRHYIPALYTTYSKADDQTLGKGVRLTQCPRCRRFADKYVEHDLVVLFIDLVLIKPPVYRHLLFNTLGREDGRFDPAVIRMGILLLLFDVYLTWARIEKATLSSPPRTTSPGHTNLVTSRPPLLQYLFFLALCALETAAFHLPIRAVLSLPRLPRPIRALVPAYPHPALVSTALLVSSFTKLFPLLLLVWRYDMPSSASAVAWAVYVNNTAALEILLDCGYLRAAALASLGVVCRAAVGWSVLRAVGVSGGVATAGVVETQDLVAFWKLLTGAVRRT